MKNGFYETNQVDEFGRITWENNQAIEITFTYKNQKNPRKLYLYRVNPADEHKGLFFFTGHCSNNDHERTFNVSQITSKITFNEQEYSCDSFLRNIVGIDPSGDYIEDAEPSQKPALNADEKEDLAGCLKFIAVIIFLTVFVSLFDTDEPVEPEKLSNKVITTEESLGNTKAGTLIKNANADDIVVALNNDIKHLSNTLLQSFKKFNASNDEKGYINWRKTQWQPLFYQTEKQYNDMLNNRRKYLFDEGLITFISALKNTELVSIRLIPLIDKRNNKTDKAAWRLLKEGFELINLEVKKRGLEDRSYAVY